MFNYIKKHKINTILITINGLIFALVAFIFLEEYFGDFPYWGYPQWYWFYETKTIYLIYHVILLTLMGLSIWFGIKSKRCYKYIIVNLPLFYILFELIYTKFFYNI